MAEIHDGVYSSFQSSISRVCLVVYSGIKSSAISTQEASSNRQPRRGYKGNEKKEEKRPRRLVAS